MLLQLRRQGRRGRIIATRLPIKPTFERLHSETKQRPQVRMLSPQPLVLDLQRLHTLRLLIHITPQTLDLRVS